MAKKIIAHSAHKGGDFVAKIK